ncbi:glycosyltransferase [candidate division KSB1 bacterium]
MKYKVIHILGIKKVGGAENALFNLFSNWKDDRFDQKIYYTRNVEGPDVPFDKIGIETIPLNWKSERGFYKIFDLVKIFQKEKPHIVHTHIWAGNYWVIIAARIARVPVIIETVHHSIKPSRFGLFMHFVFRWISEKLVDQTVCVSSQVQNFLRSNFKQSLKKTSVIINGIDPEIKIKSDAGKSLKQELSIKENTPVFITIANLRPYIKGYEVYIDALRSIAEKGLKDFKALIVGEKTADAPEFPDYLKKTVSNYGLRQNVEFLGYRNDISDLLEASDILVMPSISEGGPIVILEAMRSARPVVATKTGAVHSYVIENKSGITVQPGDSVELADAIEWMLKNKDKWGSMGQAGREHFINNFTIDKTVNEITDLYLKLLDKKGMEVSS